MYSSIKSYNINQSVYRFIMAVLQRVRQINTVLCCCYSAARLLLLLLLFAAVPSDNWPHRQRIRHNISREDHPLHIHIYTHTMNTAELYFVKKSEWIQLVSERVTARGTKWLRPELFVCLLDIYNLNDVRHDCSAPVLRSCAQLRLATALHTHCSHDGMAFERFLQISLRCINPTVVT